MKRLKDRYSFMIGTSINQKNIVEHKELILREFNSVTCENAMKLNYRIKPDGSYDFQEADILYQFAQENHLRMRGHVFVWHVGSELEYFQKMNRQQLLDELRCYIKAVAKRYPEIYAWDVVNEIIDHHSDESIRKSIFYNIIGPDYVECAFRIAREELGDNVELIYNEEEEYNAKKVPRIIEFMRELVAKNVPIDGIGLQCHLSPYESLEHYPILFSTIRELGLKCHITEFEVSVYDWDQGWYETCPAEIVEMQAKVYKTMFHYFEEYSDIIELVSFWSLSDADTWRDQCPVDNRKDWPSLFDINDCPKAIYEELVSDDSARNKWNSRYTFIDRNSLKSDEWLDTFSDIITDCKTPIIDLGCGYGVDTKYLVEMGKQVISCDYAPNAVSNIKINFPELYGAECFDMRDGLPFPDNYTNLIIADLTLHYFSTHTTNKILYELKRVLKKDGTLLLRVNSTNDVNHGAGQGLEVEHHYYKSDDNCYKRFFDEADIHFFFHDWNIVSLSNKIMYRYEAPKNLWEVAVRVLK